MAEDVTLCGVCGAYWRCDCKDAALDAERVKVRREIEERLRSALVPDVFDDRGDAAPLAGVQRLVTPAADMHTWGPPPDVVRHTVSLAPISDDDLSALSGITRASLRSLFDPSQYLLDNFNAAMQQRDELKRRSDEDAARLELNRQAEAFRQRWLDEWALKSGRLGL